MKNTVTVTVVFNNNLSARLMNTPTFIQMFGRIHEVAAKTVVPNKEYTLVTKHTHKGMIQDRWNMFSCIASVNFK